MREFTGEQVKRLKELVTMSDMDFYEKYLADADLEEVAAFLEEFPEFLEEGTAGEDSGGDDAILKKILGEQKRLAP